MKGKYIETRYKNVLVVYACVSLCVCAWYPCICVCARVWSTEIQGSKCAPAAALFIHHRIHLKTSWTRERRTFFPFYRLKEHWKALLAKPSGLSYEIKSRLRNLGFHPSANLLKIKQLPASHYTIAVSMTDVQAKHVHWFLSPDFHQYTPSHKHWFKLSLFASNYISKEKAPLKQLPTRIVATWNDLPRWCFPVHNSLKRFMLGNHMLSMLYIFQACFL